MLSLVTMKKTNEMKIHLKGALKLTESEHVELLLASAACNVDGEEHRPGDAAADKAYDNRDLKKAKKEVPIERVVL